MGDDSSNINPLALLFLAAMCVVALRGTRRSAVQALLAIAAFLPLGQQVVVAGLHFQFFRILILVGLARVLMHGETRDMRWTVMDKLFVGWALTGLICGVIREPSAIMGDRCMGAAFNAFGTWFLFRFLIRDPEDALSHLRFLAFAAMLIALAMAWEITTHRNIFAVFGGVPEMVGERDGRFRCQGPFRHPILAGTFAATLFPLMIGLWLRGGRDKRLALFGVAGCAFSTCVAASSGALLTCVTSMIGLSMWRWRFKMRWFRRGIVVVILVLAMTMQAPVWYLIAKASDLLGGTGWHRAYLIDQAVNYFREWWLIGTSVTAHWAPSGQVLAADPRNMDITNHYIEQGIEGGVLRLGLFIGMIVTCFKTIGRRVRSEGDFPLEPKVLWALGVSLACHCTAFISISYFDQMQVFWVWLLAVISSIAAAEKLTVPVEAAPEPNGNWTSEAARLS